MTRGSHAVKNVFRVIPLVPIHIIWIDHDSVTVDPSLTPSSSTAQNEEEPKQKNPFLDLQNADLIIHWITKTVYTVNPTSNLAAIEVCQTVILDEARKHHFLLHGLLALSALHYAESCSDPQKYREIAIAHYTHGLSLYHSILSNINRANDSASIAFSSMFAFGLSRPDSMKAVGIELVDDLAQIFSISMGWYKVVDVIEGLESRAGSNLFPPQEVNNTALSADTEAASDRLEALDQGLNTVVYTQAISSLKSVFRNLEKEGNGNRHIALEWGKSMPEEFVRLVKEREKLALVIVGF